VLVRLELKRRERLNLYKMIIQIIKNNHTDEDLNILKATFIQLGRIIKNNMDDSKNNINDSFTYTILDSTSYSRGSFDYNILPEQITLFIKDNGELSVESKSFLGAEQVIPAGLLIVNQTERRSKK